jgi:conjugal transfer/entry exclusion protein
MEMGKKFWSTDNLVVALLTTLVLGAYALVWAETATLRQGIVEVGDKLSVHTQQNLLDAQVFQKEYQGAIDQLKNICDLHKQALENLGQNLAKMDKILEEMRLERIAQVKDGKERSMDPSRSITTTYPKGGR